MSEHQEQVNFFKWVSLNEKHAKKPELRQAMELCYSNQTGAHMTPAQAAKMKAEGMKKGILDVNLDWPRIIKIQSPFKLDPTRIIDCCGLRLEFKYRSPDLISSKIQAKINTGDYLADLSKEQKIKREILLKNGYQVKVVYSAVQAIRIVFDYLRFEIEDYQGIKEYLNI